MARKSLRLAVLCAISGITALSLTAPAETEQEDPILSAGDFTVRRFDREAYSQPAPVLDEKQRGIFARGRHHFDKKWAVVFSLEAEWGLGPTFIATSCAECHVGVGRGEPPAKPDEQLRSKLVRISIPGTNEHGGPKPHPHYGEQIQNYALQGQSRELAYVEQPVPEEAQLYLDWQQTFVILADGERVPLRQPKLRIEKLAFGPLGATAMTSLRLAQPIIGLGLLEAVPEETILAIAKRQSEQGFHGRPNYVWDAVNKRMTFGRFGWKANQPSIKQQIATAALEDIGLTSPLFREQNCPPVQTICRMQTPGNDPEFVTIDWIETEFWTRALAVPARRSVDDPEVKRGGVLFSQARCDVCHVPTMNTAAEFPEFPAAARQTIHAYTDLLLHDMGEELADGRPDFKAGPRDWRTQPLWGIGLSGLVNGSTAMLHDGRARNAAEAILWHGGEAEASREAFGGMSKPDRQALLKFLESI